MVMSIAMGVSYSRIVSQYDVVKGLWNEKTSHMCESCDRAQQFAPAEEDKWVEEFHGQMTLANRATQMLQAVTDPAIKSTQVRQSVKVIVVVLSNIH